MNTRNRVINRDKKRASFFTTPRIRGLPNSPKNYNNIQSKLETILPYFVSLVVLITGVLILEYSF